MSSTSPAYFGYTGMIEPEGVGRIAAALNSAVNAGVQEVHLSFSSNGGYVADGVYLHNHIRALPLRLVICQHAPGPTSSGPPLSDGKEDYLRGRDARRQLPQPAAIRADPPDIDPV